MNVDIRLNVDFFDHPKTIKLQRRLGVEGVIALLKLWAFAAKHKPSGELVDMDPEEIAIAAKWGGDAATFVTTVVDVRFIDVMDGVHHLHDWVQHNGFASSADDRSDKARFSRMCKLYPDVYYRLKEQGYEAVTAAQYKEFTTPSRGKKGADGNDPSTVVATVVEPPVNDDSKETYKPITISITNSNSIPISKGDDDNGGAAKIPFEEIRLAYNKFCPSLVPAREVHGSTRWMAIRLIYAKYGEHDGGPLHFLDQLFKRAEASDTLTNRNGQWRGQPCNIDWILKEENYVRVIEGQYDNEHNQKQAKATGGKQTFDQMRQHNTKETIENWSPKC